MRPSRLTSRSVPDMPVVTPGPLYFATSSTAKLIQARLYLGSLGYRVEQVEYLARPYEEPYGQSQTVLLNRALEQILQRTTRPMLVFVEDTTVRIEALSTEVDYPGQRAKEWYLETAHDELMEELDRRARGLKAVVKSDIALNIPGADEIVFFHGETSGEILRTPAPVRNNPLYPWLESRDFSGWFRPDGASRALGAMSYDESVRFDFRIRALRELARRLDEYSAILNLPFHCLTSIRGTDKDTAQPVIVAPRDDVMLVVLGRPGAGKTTIGHYLALRHEFCHVESSSILLEAAAAHGCTQPIKADLARELFETAGYGAVEEHAVKTGLIPHGQPVVYTGVRTLEGVAALLDHAKAAGRPCFVVHIDVGERKAMYRYLDRARNDGNAPALDYRTIMRWDIQFGALPYARVAADWRLVNSGTVESLLGRLDRMLISLAEGRTRRDRPFRPRLLAALCAVAGHHGADRAGELAWLRRQHPSLVDASDLSGHGTALHRILHDDRSLQFHGQ